MRILIYNWVQFDNPTMAGGGVTMYLRNVIDELIRNDDVEIYFLSSGEKYGFLNRKPRILKTKNIYNSSRIQTFSLINSPIKAPAHDAFYSIDTWMKDDVTVGLIKKFINDNGPFDAFHIHNLEGVGANILSLDKGASLKRIFYTFHNYMPICPQIELLYDGRIPCENFHAGASCVACLSHERKMADAISYDRVGAFIKGRGLSGHPLGGFLFDIFSGTKSYVRAIKNLFTDVHYGIKTGFRHWHLRSKTEPRRDNSWKKKNGTRTVLPFSPKPMHPSPEMYEHWRNANGAAFLNNVDEVFAVSDLCAKTAMRFLPPEIEVKTTLLPIDINISASERDALRSDRLMQNVGAKTDPDLGIAMDLEMLKKIEKHNERMSISFIGYDIPSKGLPFLIDSFRMIDDSYYKGNVDLIIVARLNRHTERKLIQLESTFHSVKIIPSYDRDQITDIAKMIDLNIVPSIWWETFNQVTVELAKLGVPSLVSSNVGAKQTLAHGDKFIFESNNSIDFLTKLDNLVKDQGLRDSFFDSELNMPTLTEHVNTLLRYYSA